MFKKVEIENFGPVSEKVVFSMEKGKTEQFPENVIEKTGLLKTVYIYGPNNSGKSQLIKAFRLLNHIAEGRTTFKYDYLPNVWLAGSPLSTLTYYFEFDEIEYVYELELEFINRFIQREALKVNGKYIFERNGDKVKIDERKNEIDLDIFYLTSQYNKEGGIEAIKKIYEYSSSIIFVDQQKQFTTSNLLKESGGMTGYVDKNLDKINNLLNKFGFNFEIIVREIENEIEKEKKLYVRKGDTKMFTPLQMTESFGTTSFLQLLTLIEAVGEKGSLIVVDEIERGVHFSLIANLIKYINQAYPKKQLVLPTHMTDILGSEVDVRKDQIYITEIVNQSLTLKRSFNKKSIRETMNFQKVYKSNSVGGLPVININKQQDEVR